MLTRNKLIFLVLFGIIQAGCATIPPPKQPAVSALPAGIQHIILQGQTLYRISKIYGVNVDELMLANNITDPTKIEIGQKIFVPAAGAGYYLKSHIPLELFAIESIAGSKQTKVKWQTITLHHSATLVGNAESFDRNHRVRHMGGLFYHFVIGNGNGSGAGKIEVGWRWKQQKEANRRRDIQICLVGNFNKQEMSGAQFRSLLGLVSVLMRQYQIPVFRIRTHRAIPGVKATECPGSKFPYQQFLAELRNTN